MLFAILLFGGSVQSLSQDVFSGSWFADMTLSSVQTNPVTAFASRLDAAITLAPLTLAARSDFSTSGWLWQSFSFSTDVAFFSIQSDLLFLPDPWAFAYGGGYAKIDFGVVWAVYHLGFVGSVFTGGIPHGSVFEIGASLGPLDFRSLTYFGATLDGILFTQTSSYIACDPCTRVSPANSERYYEILPTQTGSLLFTGQEITFIGRLGGDILLTSSTVISPIGFESQEFNAEVWSIAGFPIIFDLTLRYEVQTKSLQIEPQFGFGNRDCYGQVLMELITQDNGTLITGFSLYGLDLHIETPYFAFRSLSLFDTDRFSLYQSDGYSLTDVWVENAGSAGTCGTAGQELTEYWEVMGFAVYRGDPSCSSLTFIALNFFGNTTSAFDWMQTQFKAIYSPMRDFSLRTSLTLDSSGISAWKLGISIAW